MTFKRAIGIGLLATAGIGLLILGIRTGSFNKENIFRITNKKHRSAIRVDAEEYMPVSKNWLVNNNPVSTLFYSDTTFTINYTTGDGRAYKNLMWYYRDSGGAVYTYRIRGTYANSESGRTFYYFNNPRGWVDESAKILQFETEPTGDLLSLLNQIAQPLYNNNVILYKTTPYNSYGDNTNYISCVSQLRKGNVIIDNKSLINQNGNISIYLYQGISNLKINGTQYNDYNSAINLTNSNIYIETTGTPNTNIVSYVFTINYYNTLPVIEPEPLPDASSRITEVLDITGLMFTILTMPFTFISQAFDLTLWEGTPYQFNFSNFILSLIAIATLIFIIKLFTSGFSVVGNYTSKVQNTRISKKPKPKAEKPKVDKPKEK